MGDQATKDALKQAIRTIRSLKAQSVAGVEPDLHEPIAIVGVGLRLPGGVRDVSAFAARQSPVWSQVPADRWPAGLLQDAPGSDIAGWLDHVWDVDAEALGLSSAEASHLDPAYRHFLLCAYDALATAGLAPGELPAETSVHLANSASDWAQRVLHVPDPQGIDAWSATGSLASLAAGRLSYLLGLTGPAIALDTACSGGLAALHQAISVLREGKASVAFAGAAHTILSPDLSIAFSRLGALSPTGQCQPLSPEANGYVRSEGTVVFLLTTRAYAKAHGLPTLALIYGSALGQDGRSNGLTAPSGVAQQAVIREAWRDAGLSPDVMGLASLHGTGTPLGDPIEVGALSAVLGAQGPPVPVLAGKAVWGHTEPAAGLVGVLSAVAALQAGVLPTWAQGTWSSHLGAQGRLVRDAKAIAPDALAGVSAFGLAGTNAHVVVGLDADATPLHPPRSWHPVTLYRPDPRVLAGASVSHWTWTSVPFSPRATQAIADVHGAHAIARALYASVVDVQTDAHGVLIEARALSDELELEDLRLLLQQPTPVLLLLPDLPQTASPKTAALAAFARAVSAERGVATLSIVHLGDAPAAQVAKIVPHAVSCELVWDGQAFSRLTLQKTVPVSLTVPPQRGHWVVFGGTGAVGAEVVRALASAGASAITLVSRTAPAQLERGVELPQGVSAPVLYAHALDLLDTEARGAWLASGALQGVQGVVWSAGFTEDVRVCDLSAHGLERQIELRWRALSAIDQATRVEGCELRVVASASAWVGVAGQAAYAAGCAASEALIRARREAGFAGGVIALGPVESPMTEGLSWSGITVMARRTVRALFNVHEGLLLEADACSRVRAYDRVCADNARANTEGLAEVVPAFLHEADALAFATECVASVLEVAQGSLDPDRGLVELGVDSLAAIEIARRVGAQLSRGVSSSLVYEVATLRGLAAWCLGTPANEATPQAPPEPRPADHDIAICSLAARFPGGAHNVDTLFQVLCDERDLARPIPRDRFDGRVLEGSGTTPVAVCLDDDVFAFDPVAFHLSPREATAIDPVQRMLLQLTIEALDDAGVDIAGLTGQSVGVWIGADDSEYGDRFDHVGDTVLDRAAGPGNAPSFAAGRIAHHLGLVGPALVVQTACSSSLVALALAVEALRARRVDMALVGGAHLLLGSRGTRRLAAMRALSLSGKCRPFDVEADGFVRGEGAAVLVLRRMSDLPDPPKSLLGIIRGVAVAHDGAAAGLFAPNAPAQVRVAQLALQDAGLEASQVSWLEAHGTGTKLGDPVELSAVAQVHKDRSSPLILTASKGRVGHLEAAAGLVGLASVLGGFRARQIPPIAGLASPVPTLADTSLFHVVEKSTTWPSERPRIAAISAFGMSGTNAQVIVEAPEKRSPIAQRARTVFKTKHLEYRAAEHHPEPPVLPVWWLAGESAEAVRALADEAGARLEHEPMFDVVTSVTLGAGQGGWRATWVGLGRRAAHQWLTDLPNVSRPARARLLAIVPGEASEVIPVVALRSWPAASATLARGIAALPSSTVEGVLRALDGQDAAPDHVAIARYFTAVALGRLLQAFGLDVTWLGVEEGEVAAATLAGVWSLESGISVLLAWRWARDKLPVWPVVRIPCEASDLPDVSGVYVRAYPSPRAVIVTGAPEALDTLAAQMGGRDGWLWLTPSPPMHTPVADTVASRFVEAVRAAHPQAVSSWMGTGVENPADPTAWGIAILSPVRMLEALRRAEPTVVVELGLRPVMLVEIRRALPTVHAFEWLMVPGEGLEHTVSKLWEAGLPLDPRVCVARWNAPVEPQASERAQTASDTLSSRYLGLALVAFLAGAALMWWLGGS